jgi:alanyl-tRNA synthetase
VSDRDLYRRVEELVEEKKALEKELAALQRSNAAGGLDDIMASAGMAGDVRLVAGRVDVADMDALKSVGDGLREKLSAAGGGIGLLGAAIDGKAMLVCVVTDDLTKRYPAGTIVGAAAKRLGGGGGGRPHLATAGGKDLEKLDEVLASAADLLAEIG